MQTEEQGKPRARAWRAASTVRFVYLELRITLPYVRDSALTRRSYVLLYLCVIRS